MRRKVAAIVLFMATVIASLSIGTSGISWASIWQGDGRDMFILLSGRIPRTLTVLLAGAGLSLSGLVMQALTQNRFAAPDTVGTIEWAKLGLLLGLLFLPGLSGMRLLFFAFLFSAIGTVLFLWASSRIQFRNQMTIPLLGLMYGNVVGGFADFLSFRYNLLQSLSAWTQGNFALVIEGRYEPIFLILILIAGLYFFADYLTISRFGREAAKTLGLPFEAVLIGGTLLVSLSVAVILITAGTLPFLGVIIPNLVALRWGDNIRNTHQQTAFLGAFFLLVCDIISRVLIAPYEVPVELIVGMTGGSLFLWLLFKGVRRA